MSNGEVQPLFGQLYLLLNICLILVCYSVNFASFFKRQDSLKEAFILRLCLRIADKDKEENDRNMVRLFKS